MVNTVHYGNLWKMMDFDELQNVMAHWNSWFLASSNLVGLLRLNNNNDNNDFTTQCIELPCVNLCSIELFLWSRAHSARACDASYSELFINWGRRIQILISVHLSLYNIRNTVKDEAGNLFYILLVVNKSYEKTKTKSVLVCLFNFPGQSVTEKLSLIYTFTF